MVVCPQSWGSDAMSWGHNRRETNVHWVGSIVWCYQQVVVNSSPDLRTCQGGGKGVGVGIVEN